MKDKDGKEVRDLNVMMDLLNGKKKLKPRQQAESSKPKWMKYYWALALSFHGQKCWRVKISAQKSVYLKILLVKVRKFTVFIIINYIIYIVSE